MADAEDKLIKLGQAHLLEGLSEEQKSKLLSQVTCCTSIVCSHAPLTSSAVSPRTKAPPSLSKKEHPLVEMDPKNTQMDRTTSSSDH